MVAGAQPAIDTIWQWLAEVVDPEIPVLSIVDLGIVRDVRWSGAGSDGELVVAITPTYSGCPATEMIARDIRTTLSEHGISKLRLVNQLAPAWTTDWMTESAKEQLLAYGIVPPQKLTPELLPANGLFAAPIASVLCPRCRSTATEMVSRFGSTPCKSLYRCRQCLEPFDVFKCH